MKQEKRWCNSLGGVQQSVLDTRTAELICAGLGEFHRFLFFKKRQSRSHRARTGSNQPTNPACLPFSGRTRAPRRSRSATAGRCLARALAGLGAGRVPPARRRIGPSSSTGDKGVDEGALSREAPAASSWGEERPEQAGERDNILT